MTEETSRPKEKAPVFVAELRSEGDYWLTITDAARVSRRQEVTIRRWVASGALPVRRQTVGLNQRTRHIRASDLAQLTPIIDTAAAISGATAQVDLVSIPAQQAQILATHTILQHDLEAVHTRLEQAVEQLTLLTQEQHVQREHFVHLVEAVERKSHAALQAAHDRWRQERASLHHEIQQQQAALSMLDTTLHHEAAEDRQTLQARLTELSERLTAQHAWVQERENTLQADWRRQLKQLRDDIEQAYAEQQLAHQQAMEGLAVIVQHIAAQLTELQHECEQHKTREQQWRTVMEHWLRIHHTVMRRATNRALHRLP